MAAAAAAAHRLLSLVLTACVIFACISDASLACLSNQTYDVVIYGNTVAALSAAIQTKRMGKTVAIVSPRQHLGGLTTSGLGWTDSKNGSCVGGIAREFYTRIYNYYQNQAAWKYESRSNYLAENIRAQPGPAIDDSQRVQWTFEPHVAEQIIELWLLSNNIPVFRNESINRSGTSVQKIGTRITSFQTRSGCVFRGKMFIDAGYEGDLMEMSGIPYRTGREGRTQFNESYAGILVNGLSQISNVDPYIVPGNPSSGLLPGITRSLPNGTSIDGMPDNFRIQSYNFRLALTTVDSNKILFYQPPGYKQSTYELLFRYIESGYDNAFFTTQLMPNKKTDTNAAGQVSTDLIGGSFNATANYAESTYQQRDAAVAAHKLYTQGLLWTLANHPRIPQSIRALVGTLGYAKDEWTTNGNWPYEIYIREARRMAGLYTMTQFDVQQPLAAAPRFNNDSIVGIGAYSMDVHQVERVVFQGRIHDEGLVEIPTKTPFAVPLGALLPRGQDATNFLNPVTLSSTHISYSAMRMEPLYMVLGQSAATAAVMAIEQGVDIQNVDRKKLSQRLLLDNQVVTESAASPLAVPRWLLGTGLTVGLNMI